MTRMPSTLPEPTTSANDVSQIQADLLSLLNTESPAPTRPAAAESLEDEAAGAPTAEGCPSCGFTGSWGMNSWCPKCGHFPRFGRSGETPTDETQTDELPPALWELVSGWIWVLIGGMVAIVAQSLLLPVFLQDPLLRGNAALTQIFIGILLGVVAQIRAYVLSSRTSENFKFYSIVTSPIAIWRGAVKLLPESRTVFFMAAWGWTAVLSGGLLIGVHWPVYLKAIQEHVRNQREAEAAAKSANPEVKKEDEEKEKEPGEMTFGEFIGEIGKTFTPEEEKPRMKFRNGKDADGNLEEAMNQLLSDVPADMKEGEDADAAAKGEGDGESEDEKKPESLGQRCVIIGYTANASGEVRSLLVAAPLRDGRLRFAAKLPLDSLTNRDLLELRKVLTKLRSRNPACACPFGGVWIQPVLQCRVLNDGWTGEGRLRNARVEELILESIQAPAPRSAAASKTVR